MEFRLFNENFLDSENLVSTTFSSEQANFPAENILTGNRRSKVWRTAGQFKVTALNNKIIFQESVGVDLTATIAVGSYASIAAMRTAIKTALEAVGANTYTVTNSSSTGFKFIIEASGGPYFALMLTNVLFTSASMLGYSTAADLTASMSYPADFLRIMTDEWLRFDMGIPSNPSCFALIGPRGYPLLISNAATIKIQASSTDAWDSPEFETVVPYDSEVISKVVSAGIASQPYRYWRVQIIDQNPAGYIEAGVLFLGNSYTVTKGGMIVPFQNSGIDRSQIIVSEGGQEFAIRKPKSNNFGLTLNGDSKLDYENIEAIQEQFGISIPFFVSFDDSAVYSSTINRKIKYVKFLKPVSLSNFSEKFFSCDMTFAEQV